MENAQDADDSATAIPLNCEEGDDDFIVVTSVQPMEQEEISGLLISFLKKTQLPSRTNTPGQNAQS